MTSRAGVRSAVYRVDHETRYIHPERVSTAQQVAILSPRTLPQQRVYWHTLDIDPLPTSRSRRTDSFGNDVEHFALLNPYLELRVSSHSLVEVQAADRLIQPENSPSWEQVRDAGGFARGRPYDPSVQFRYPSPFVVSHPDLAAFAQQSFTPGRPLLAAAIDLMHLIHREFLFDPGATAITTPVTRVLAERHGVCQDFAHLHIGCLRSLGLPARYVSGYLLTDPPPGQPRLIGADASHAWVSVRCPRYGWVDLDPTNDVIPGLRHIVLAWGRDYSDVSPLRGVVLGPPEHELRVGVSVLPSAPPESERRDV